MSNQQQQQQQKENVLDDQQEQQIVHSLSRFLKSSSSTVDPGQSSINTSTTANANNNSAFTVSRYAIPRLGTPTTAVDQQHQQNHLVSSRPSSAMSDYETGDTSANIEEEITAEYLKSITGFDELHFVSDVELKVNNKTQSVHLLSSFLPNVVHLRLSRSNISSIRELGTTFTSLRVLWLAASRLNSLNGIQHIGSHLRELFLAFNNIKDVTPLCLGGMKHLEVLDLEGNMIEDGESAIKDLISLENLPSLKSLNLVGNPFISSAEDHDENENEDEDDEDDYSHHTHQYHKMVLRRIREVNEEQEEEEQEQDLDDDDENQSKNTNNKKKKKVPLEYLDDTPIEEIQVKVMVADSNKNNKNTDDDGVFDGQHDDDESKNNKNKNNSSEIDEEFASARRRLQSRRENENKRNDPLFRTMFDELSLLQNAIRSQLGQTGENLVAEETVRTTSQLMSRQRSLAPDEQRQRVRVATARGQQQQQQPPHGQSSSSRPTSGEETKNHQPAPPPQSKKMMPTPPTSSSRMNSASPTSSSSTTTPVSPTSENNNGEDSAAAAVGSLVHRLRSNKKLQQEKTGISPEKEKEQEESLSMAEILSKKISTSTNEKNRQQVSQRDPRFAARRRQQMEETDRLLDEIDAKYAALENDDDDQENENGDENSSSDQHRKKPLFQSWLPHSKSHRYQDPNDDKSRGNTKISGRRTGTSTNSSTRSSSQNSSVSTTKSDDDEDYLRPVSRSHKDRMHQARKLLDLANKKKEHAEKKLIRRQERKRGERENDDDDGEMSSDVSSVSSFTSSTYSTTTAATTYSSSLSSSSRSSSSVSSCSSASSSSKNNNDDDKKLSSTAKRHHHDHSSHGKVQAAPISDSEILQEVLVDKEIALAKLKKDIAGRDGFLTAVGDSSKGKNFEAVEWQGGDAEKVQNTL